MVVPTYITSPNYALLKMLKSSGLTMNSQKTSRERGYCVSDVAMDLLMTD